MTFTDEELQKITPMMRQYLDTKAENPDSILFYRLGDFYEMFFDDAKIASKELELTLTKKSCGLDERAPMCGVPHHAVESYLARLVKKGYKVAICEQVEDPSTARGIVKREVIRVVTPGTTLDAVSLDEGRHNYLMAVVFAEVRFGITFCDVTTGDCFVTEVKSVQELTDELHTFSPSEIVCNEPFFMSGVDIDTLREKERILVSSLEPFRFEENFAKEVLYTQFHVSSTDGLGLTDFPVGMLAAGACLSYLKDTQMVELSHINRIRTYRSGNFMLLDAATRRNLELTETMRDKEKRGSLLYVLDKTKTAMGARMLRSWLEQPLKDKSTIESRLDAVEELHGRMVDREEIREYLGVVYDLERLMTRIVYRTANPRDLLSFKQSIGVLPAIRQVLADFKAGELAAMYAELDELADLCELIETAITDEPPVSVHEGGILRLGYNAEIDELRAAKTEGKQWLSDLEAKEREKTGIQKLRVKYNKVFGYYLEVTNSFLSQVPDYFIRKQTLTNAERYYTPELKELENKILGAEERLTGLEHGIYMEILTTIAREVERIQKSAHILAKLDAFQSFAHVAEKNDYHRPAITENGEIRIKKGRHPVIETMTENGLFVSNDTRLDEKNERVAIITGPNMAGKSTYMRQTALIVLMAQIGSFVPAESAEIGIVDRIFTRVGASDDLASGQSTFMVEMNEVANILRNATKHSLLILDEIGRGTSTFDGLSIAWSVVEHIADPKIIGAKTLFATHYHELAELEGKIPGVRNFCIAVKENGDDIVFLRKIVSGGADKSYGIQVAKLAGLPETVISRAKVILAELIENDLSETTRLIAEEGGALSSTSKQKGVLDEVDRHQMSLFETVSDEDIIEELRSLDISNMTPIAALSKLDELQNKVNGRWG